MSDISPILAPPCDSLLSKEAGWTVELATLPGHHQNRRVERRYLSASTHIGIRFLFAFPQESARQVP